MTLEKIRQKVRELHAKTRRQLLGSLVVPFAVVAFYGFAMKQFHGLVLRSLFAFAIAWSLAGLYFLNRGMWSAPMPGDAALSTGLEFYRREVERRRSLFDRSMLWSFGPVIFAIATLIVLILSLATGNRDMPINGALLKMTPFLTMVVVWITGVFVIRMRERRKLQREIDELNEIVRANP